MTAEWVSFPKADRPEGKKGYEAVIIVLLFQARQNAIFLPFHEIHV